VADEAIDGEEAHPVLVVTHHRKCFDRAIDDFTAVGWSKRDDFDLADGAWDVSGQKILCTGCVAGLDDVAPVVGAAARGAAVVVWSEPSCPAYASLVTDLSKIGQLRVLHGEAGGEALPEEERQLLMLLAEGLTVREAAQRCSLSVRSAERRLSSARRRLGVGTTTEAVSTVLRVDDA
jgi:DNA-binding CsgD family transcriptional regulator